MKTGEKFPRDSMTYEVLQDGLQHRRDNKKSCILPPAASRCITIPKALKEGLIRQIEPGSGASAGDQIKPGEVGIGESSRAGVATQELNLFSEVGDADLSCREGAETYQVEKSAAASMTPADAIDITSETSADVFYLPVDSVRGRLFLARGLIYQDAIALENTSEFRDDLARFPSYIPVQTRRRVLPEHQLRLVLALTAAEIRGVDRREGRLLLAHPLPVSRLLRIEMPSEQKLAAVDGWIYPDIPIPRHLIALTPRFPSVEPGDHEMTDVLPANGAAEEAVPLEDLRDSARRYDRYLGLMAYVRNAGRYLSKTTEIYEEVPGLFARAVRLIDKKIPDRDAQGGEPFDEEILCALLDVREAKSPALRALLKLMWSTEHYIDKQKGREVANAVYETSGRDDALGQAFGSLFRGDYISAMAALQNCSGIPEASLLATLHKYSDRGANDHRILKQQLHEVWQGIDELARALALLGAYFGYTALDARETRLHDVHPLLDGVVDPSPPLKFHLESYFERRLVEAVFNWAFRRSPLDDWNLEPLMHDQMKTVCSVAEDNLLDAERVQVTHHVLGDLQYRRLDLSTYGRVIELLQQLDRPMFDESSELGRYLLWDCLPHADMCTLQVKDGRTEVSYRIAVKTVIDLIRQGRIHPNPAMIVCALEQESVVETTS